MDDKEHLLKCTKEILALAEIVYYELGSGYKEDIYQKALAIHFRKKKIRYYKESKYMTPTNWCSNICEASGKYNPPTKERPLSSFLNSTPLIISHYCAAFLFLFPINELKIYDQAENIGKTLHSRRSGVQLKTFH